MSPSEKKQKPLLKKKIEPAGKPAVGLRLVKSLTEQLTGVVKMVQDGRTVFSFTLHPKKPVKVPGMEERNE
jgi:two-component sensor histidine kinase